MRRYLIIIVITLALIGFMWRNSPLYKQQKAVTVSAAEVSKKDIYDSVIAKGNIQEGNAKKIYLSTSVKVKKIHVTVGDNVKAGDVLFEVEPIKADDRETKLAESLLPELGLSKDQIVSAFSQYGLNDILPKTETQSGDITQEPIVKSPISGVVTELNLKEDDIFSGVSAAATVSDFNNLFIKVHIPELYIGRIKVGQTAEITGDAFQDNKFYGTVSKILPVAKQTSSLGGTGETVVDTIVNISNSYEKLKPGYSISAKIITNRIQGALTLPYECVIQDEKNRELVYVVKDGRAYKKRVETGYELENEIEIRSGLTSEDSVIINPPKDLKNGSKIIVSK